MGLLIGGIVLIIFKPYQGDDRLASANSLTASSLPDAWQSMDTAMLNIQPANQTPPHTLRVRVADDSAERAQGMQHLPSRVVRDEPIWFVFPTPRRTGWHMRNVRIALDIVYVDASGRVISIERMQPEGTGYGIDVPIAAALEVAAGQAKKLDIQPGSIVSLSQ